MCRGSGLPWGMHEERRGSMSTRFEDAVTASWGAFEKRLGAALHRLGDGWIEIRVMVSDDSDEEPMVDIGGVPSEVRAFLYDAPAARFRRVDGPWLASRGTPRRGHGLGGEAPVVPDRGAGEHGGRSSPNGVRRARPCIPGRRHGSRRHDREDADAESDEEAAIEAPGELVEPPISTPTCVDELQSLVDQTLSAHLEVEVQHDDDGDVAITNGIVPVWVQVSPTAPQVRVFSIVASSVERTRQARIEMDVLNRRTTDISFYLEQDHVIAEAYVNAHPFVPQHLSQLVDHVLTTLDDLAPDLALRVGGRMFFEGVLPPAGEST